jgi:hypothetical protein
MNQNNFLSIEKARKYTAYTFTIKLKEELSPAMAL